MASDDYWTPRFYMYTWNKLVKIMQKCVSGHVSMRQNFPPYISGAKHQNQLAQNHFITKSKQYRYTDMTLIQILLFAIHTDYTPKLFTVVCGHF